ncbi:MAG: TolC family protein [Acidiferrobacterales bacterium]
MRDGQALKRRLFREAREALQDLIAEDRRHRVSRERLKQAKKALKLADIRYRRGLSNNLDVLDAEAAYSAAELDILRTLVA